jgi:hypothetical protein
VEQRHCGKQADPDQYILLDTERRGLDSQPLVVLAGCRL